MEVNLTNFWDLQYIWYIFGFLFAPRLSMILIFNNYVTAGFVWHNLFLMVTIWWKYEILALGWLSKLSFTMLFSLFPRLFLGIIGYMYLSHENHTAMIVYCVLGFIIDTAIKFRKQIFVKFYVKLVKWFPWLRDDVEPEEEKTENKLLDIKPKSRAHSFGYIYLTCAGMDGKIDNDEILLIGKKITDWVTLTSQNVTSDDLKDSIKITINETVEWFTATSSDRFEIFKTISLDLSNEPSFGPTTRKQVLCDLIEIAKADKDYSEKEEGLINVLSKAWNTPLPE